MQEHKERVALTSMAASGGLTVAKAAVGVLSGSLALLSEAAHSALDFAATVMTWYAVRISGKPADEEHHYGHGKVESVTALIETGLLFILSAFVVWEAAKRLLANEGHIVEATVWAFAVIFVSIVVDFLRARLLYRVAKETMSEALEADALHFGSDMWSSIAVLIGLGGVALGYPWADSAAAIVVAVFIVIAGWRLGWRTVETLTDTAPEGSARAHLGDCTPASAGWSQSSGCACAPWAPLNSSTCWLRSAARSRSIAWLRSRPPSPPRSAPRCRKPRSTW